MRFVIKTAIALIASAFSLSASAQTPGADVFVPISKYIAKGEAEPLSAWFDDYLAISVSDTDKNASKTQAKQIMRSFFEQNTPSAFTITSTASQGEMKYAMGNLEAGGKAFSVTIFVIYKGDRYKIQQLKIEK